MKKKSLIFLLLLACSGWWYFFSCDQQNTNISAKGCYARIPIEFIGNHPLVEVELEGKKYPVKLDLGAECQFAFFEEILKEIPEKKFVKFITTTDVKGNRYKVSSYSVPHVKMKNFAFENVAILEEARDFATKGAVLWRRGDKKQSHIPFVGRIGRECFRSNNLFIDFPNSVLFVTSNLEQLKMDHWPVCDLFETSFEMGRWGIILSIETDIGLKRFVLDTGTSASILKKAHAELPSEKQVFTTTKFSINGHDFGPIDLSLFEMTSSIDADGLLGLDFLKKHAIYIDFKNKKAFIGPSSEICGAIIF